MFVITRSVTKELSVKAAITFALGKAFIQFCKSIIASYLHDGNVSDRAHYLPLIVSHPAH
jgi:hypothetical protein